MSVEFIESFDLDTSFYPTCLTNRGWTLGDGAVTINTTNGRTGSGSAIHWNSGSDTYMERAVASAATKIVCFALRPVLGNVHLRLYNGTTEHLDLSTDGSGHIVVKRGDGTTLATSTSTISANTWVTLQVQATIDDSTGSVYVDVDGVNYITLTGADTRNGGTAVIDKVRFPGNGSSYFDDIIIANTSGSRLNTRAEFAGAFIEAHFVTGAGSNTNWTPSAGSNYQNVDETAPNDDTDYNSASTVGTKDTFAMGDMTATTGSVLAVQTMFRARKDDGVTHTVCDEIRSGGTDYDGTTQTITGGYVDYYHVAETDPATSNPWSISAVNAAEVGVKVLS